MKDLDGQALGEYEIEVQSVAWSLKVQASENFTVVLQDAVPAWTDKEVKHAKDQKEMQMRQVGVGFQN